MRMIRVRVDEQVYEDLTDEAAVSGVTLAEHARAVLAWSTVSAWVKAHPAEWKKYTGARRPLDDLSVRAEITAWVAKQRGA